MAQTFQKNFKSFSVIGKVREGCKMNAHYSTKLATNEMCAVRTYFAFFFFFLENKHFLFAKIEILSLWRKHFFLINIFLTSGLLLPQISFFFFKIGLCTLMKNLQNRHMLLFTLKLSKVISCDRALLVFSTFFSDVSGSWDVCVYIYNWEQKELAVGKAGISTLWLKIRKHTICSCYAICFISCICHLASLNFSSGIWQMRLIW